jgi:hypothetical protein
MEDSKHYRSVLFTRTFGFAAYTPRSQRLGRHSEMAHARALYVQIQ